MNVRSIQLEYAVVLHRAILSLFKCMGVRQWYGNGKKDLGLRQYRWIIILRGLLSSSRIYLMPILRVREFVVKNSRGKN